MSLAENEPFLRMSVGYLGMASNYIGRLPSTDYDSALDRFHHHLAEAENQLREWASANDIEILDRMKT